MLCVNDKYGVKCDNDMGKDLCGGKYSYLKISKVTGCISQAVGGLACAGPITP